MKDTIVITLPLKDRHIEKLRSVFPDENIHFTPGDNTVTGHHRKCTIYLGLPTEEELHAYPNLKFIQAGYAGIDALPSDVLKNPEIIVASAKGIHNIQMSELFFAMILYCSRNMPAWNLQKQRGEWNREPVKDAFFLDGLSLCIVGYGTIGKKIAMIAKTFDMRVIGVRSTIQQEERTSDPFADVVIAADELAEVIRETDIILNLLPLTDATRDFFNDERFDMMKSGSLFVNLGRGATVVDTALIKALDNGKIKYAALDVFREEPLPDDHPFWKHPRIYITPHIGGLMPDYWGAVVDLFIENMKRLESGEALLNIVDKNKGY